MPPFLPPDEPILALQDALWSMYASDMADPAWENRARRCEAAMESSELLGVGNTLLAFLHHTRTIS
jgi:hypothetical protein